LNNFSEILDNTKKLTKKGIEIENSLNSIFKDLNSSNGFKIGNFLEVVKDLIILV